jgi:spermidine synthase
LKARVYAILTGFIIFTLAAVAMRTLASAWGNSAANPPAVGFAIGLGLALGAYYFSKAYGRSDAGPRTLALIFLGSALCLLVLIRVLPAMYRAYGFLHSLGPASPGALLLVRWLLTVAVLIVPAFLLGGAVARLALTGTSRPRERAGEQVAMGFIGAAAAAPLMTLMVLPRWGVSMALVLATILSAAMSGLSLLTARAPAPDLSSGDSGEAGTPGYGPASAAYMLISFSTFSLMFLWLRVLQQVTGANSYTLLADALVMTLGPAAGCFVASRLFYASREGNLYTGLLAVVTAIYALSSTGMADGLPMRFLGAVGGGSATTAGFFGAYLMLAAITMLLPAVLLGAALAGRPAPAGPGGEPAAGAGLRRAFVPALAGAVLASVLALPVAYPGLGLQTALMVMAWLSLAGGALLMGATPASRARQVGAVAVGTAVCIILTATHSPWNRAAITSGVYVNPAFYAGMEDPGSAISSGDVPYYAEDREGIVAVVRTSDGTFLKVNGAVVGSASERIAPDILAAHIPMLLHKNPRNVLLLGLGTGVTLGSIQRYEVDRVTAVEPVAAVTRAAPFFSFYTNNALEDRRTSVVRMSPREFMHLAADKYDVVIGCPSAHSDAVHASSLTLDYMLLARSVLAFDGIYCTSLDLAEMSRECFMRSVNGILAAFPYVTAWYGGSTVILLVGSMEPVDLSESTLSERLKRPWVSNDLKRLQINSEAGLIANFMMNREALRSYLGAFSRMNSDSRPCAACEAAPLRTPGGTIADMDDLNRFRVNPALLLTGYDKDSVEYKLARDRYGRCVDASNYYLGSYLALAEGDRQEASRRLEYAVGQCTANGLMKERLSFMYIYISRELGAAGRLDEAINVARRAIEVSPVNYLAFYNLAGLERTRDPATAVALLERLDQLNPDFLPADILRAEALLEAGNVEDASDVISEVLAREPLNIRAHHIRALCFVERGLTEAARVELEYVLEAEPDNVEALAALGYTWLLVGDIGEAEKYYSKALELEPENLGVLNNYATILAEKGDYRKAIRLWQKALAIDPSNAGIRANIQEATQKMNQD